MSDCPTCGNHSWLCQQCKMDELEDRHGLPVDQDPDLWVLIDGLWHASVAFDGETHTCNCGETAATPLTRSCADLRHIPEKYDAPVCRKCATTLEGHRQETVPEDATFERASELRADGGTVTEGELVDRAVREAVDLVEAGDSRPVAVDYVADEHELGHRRDDIDERVRERLDQTVATDGGVDQSSSDTDRLTCPECGDPLEVDEEWQITDPSLIGTEAGSAEEMQGDYAHARCVQADHEPVTDGGRDPEELVVVTCDPCDYQTVVAVGTLPMTSCPDCQGDLEIDDGYVAHKCPDATGFNHVTVEKGERCPFCQTVQGQPVATDGGADIDPEAAREETSFFIRGSNARGADAALHLPTEDATRDDLSVRCKYNQRTGVSWHVQEADATPDWQLEKRGCSECFGTATRPTDEQCGRKPSDVLEEAGFDADLVTDGGRDIEGEPSPEGREAFLVGEAHWCDICSTPFDSLAELSQHDCVDADGDTDEAVTDGGHEPGSIETRLAEIDKQAGIVLEDLDQEGLDPTARAAVEGYLGTIQFYTEAVECLLEDGAPSDDDDDEGGTPIPIADGGSQSRSSDGMRCHDCGHEHDDWTKDGEHAVDDGHHAGIIERWKCGICGAITEGGRR